MTNLQIECPSCQQAFEVGEELRGRTVECGSCEKRFVVNEIVAQGEGGRFYPDEIRKSVDTTKFRKTPVEEASVDFRTMEYNEIPESNWVGPIPKIRNFAVFCGVAILVLIALLGITGARPNGFFQDVGKVQRVLVCSILCLAPIGLLFWGMVRKPKAGLIAGVIGSLAVLLLVFQQPVIRSITSKGPLVSIKTEDDIINSDFVYLAKPKKNLTLNEVAIETRWEETVNKPMSALDNEEQIVAIWVRDMEEYQRFEISSYLSQELSLAVPPDYRSLTDGVVFVMAGQPFDLEEVESIAARFGHIENVHPELRMVIVGLNAGVLGKVSNELTVKLNDRNDGAFYHLNYNELIALDQSRVKSAIRRLRRAEPIRLRKEITVRLVGLVGEEQTLKTYGELGEALVVWSEPGDGSDQIMVNLALKLRAKRDVIPKGVLHFLAERKPKEAASLLVELWVEDPSDKKSLIEKYGAGAAELLTSYLRSSQRSLAISAASILGNIGGKEQIKLMEEALSGTADDELKGILQDSIERIRRH